MSSVDRGCLQMWSSILILFVVLALCPKGYSQSHGADFIYRSGNRLYCNNIPFYAIGVNSYFLQTIAAYDDSLHIEEIFSEAKMLGVSAIRTWGFNDSPDSTDGAVIQWKPGRYSPRGLKALDFVIAKAAEYSIRLIIPLVNNWDDYGGMNQYVRWYAEGHSEFIRNTRSVSQRVIKGVEGRSYEYIIDGSLTHDDFYTSSTIKQWYKDYVAMILDRVNTITNRQYKDEPAIFLWELANEPRSSDASGGIVAQWADEISFFIKSIDGNHLIAMGEEGFDVASALYHPPDSYNNQEWLFNGSGGISFCRNILLPMIDVASIHSYPLEWGLTLNQGVLWLRDHQRISDASQKPLVLGEVGVKKHPGVFYEVLFNEGLYRGTAGILPWQFIYDGRPNNDGFAFSYPKDTRIWNVIERYAELYLIKQPVSFLQPNNTFLLQNYPNPFNMVTSISYTLVSPSFVRLEVFNSIGQWITTLVDEDQQTGTHQSLFDGRLYSSGIYCVRLNANNVSATRKINLMK